MKKSIKIISSILSFALVFPLVAFPVSAASSGNNNTASNSQSINNENEINIRFEKVVKMKVDANDNIGLNNLALATDDNIMEVIKEEESTIRPTPRSGIAIAGLAIAGYSATYNGMKEFGRYARTHRLNYRRCQLMILAAIPGSNILKAPFLMAFDNGWNGK